MKKTRLKFILLAMLTMLFMANCCLSLEPIDDIFYIWECEEPYMCFDFGECRSPYEDGIMEIDGEMKYVDLQLTYCGSTWTIVTYDDVDNIILSGPRWGCRGDTLTLYGERTYVFHKIEKFPTIESLESSFKGSKVA